MTLLDINDVSNVNLMLDSLASIHHDLMESADIRTTFLAE